MSVTANDDDQRRVQTHPSVTALHPTPIDILPQPAPVQQPIPRPVSTVAPISSSARTPDDEQGNPLPPSFHRRVDPQGLLDHSPRSTSWSPQQSRTAATAAASRTRFASTDPAANTADHSNPYADIPLLFDWEELQTAERLPYFVDRNTGGNTWIDPPLPTQDRRFSITISALDLATTPFALERAKQQELDTRQETTLTAFLENYQSYPTFLNRFPPLRRRLQTYEARTLKSFIRTASQSQSILIQIIQDDSKLDGILSRRRVVPVVEENNFFQKIILWIKGECNPRRSLEALDPATKHSVAVFKFDQDYGKLWKNCPFSYENERKRFLSQLNGRQRRRRKWRRRRLFYLIGRGLVIVSVITLVALLVLLNVLGIGAVLGWFPFLDWTTSDRRLCGTVNSGPRPCTITSNPDVAGIGGRIALYLQIFLLAVLLSFSPKEATSVTWTLVFTSTSLALSGLIAMATSKLTLYHATLTAKIQGLPITVLTIVEIFPPRQRGPYIFLLQIFRFAVSLAILTWYTVMAPCFGSQPECNAYVVTHSIFSSDMAIASAPRATSLDFVVVGFTSNFLSHVLFPKRITLAFQSLYSGDARRKWYGLPAGFIERKTPATWNDLVRWAVVGIFDDNSRPPFVKLKPRSAPVVSQTPFSLPYPVTTTNFSPPSLFNKLQICYKTTILNIQTALGYPKVWRLMIAFAIGGVLVYELEATISSNTVDVEENIWTYGQVLAVILTAIPVVQVLQLVGLQVPQENKLKGVGQKEKVL